MTINGPGKSWKTWFQCLYAVCMTCVVAGMKDGQQIRFSGEGDQSPGLEAGDVVIVLDEKEHNVFSRRGIDLSMTLELSLTEALCGFQRHIQTLDNRTLGIMSLPGTSASRSLARFMSAHCYNYGTYHDHTVTADSTENNSVLNQLQKQETDNVK